MNFIPFLSFHLTINNNVATTKITRRNTIHKNTRSNLGNCKVDREVLGGPIGPIVLIVDAIQCKVY
jgi:hypothetical protein